MVDRIATSTQTNSLLTNNMRLQGKYAQGQVQLSTGMKSDNYQGIAKDSRQILSLESDYQRTATQTENAQTALDRNEATYNALGSVFDVGQSFMSDLNAAISSTGVSETELQFLAEQSLEQIAGALNTQQGGRYLFGGSATQSPPVELNDPAFGGAVIPSTPNTNYYQGNDYVQSVEVDDNYTINYGVNADDPAIEEIMRAFDLVRTTPGDPDTLQEALSLIESGLDGLAETRASTSQGSAALDQKINENLEDMNLLDNMIADIKEVDLAEVTVRLQELESQLEASYSVTTDLLRLNITNFI